MRHNIHLLTHLADTVSNWGPMWCNNAFVFESSNRRIINKVTSPHGRLEQVVHQFTISKFIEAPASDELISIETRNCIKKLFNLSCNNTCEQPKVVNFCKPKVIKLIDTELQCLLPDGYATVKDVMTFDKIKINGLQYSCKNNKKFKYCNSIMFCKNIGFGKISKNCSN